MGVSYHRNILETSFQGFLPTKPTNTIGLLIEIFPWYGKESEPSEKFTLTTSDNSADLDDSDSAKMQWQREYSSSEGHLWNPLISRISVSLPQELEEEESCAWTCHLRHGNDFSKHCEPFPMICVIEVGNKSNFRVFILMILPLSNLRNKAFSFRFDRFRSCAERQF